ncbi:glycine-rich domain-containing protein [Streptomyces violascens]|uniref:glycine-rich domain-containing protein n=1 Tax=Streptomyces violascens TaxID=67381 RepID=UPI00368EA3D9
MTLTQEHTAQAAANPRDLITPQEFAGVVATVLDNNTGMAADVAERIVAEALAFVAACAQFPGSRLKPSRVVDEGWHALILHTGVYARLCRSMHRFVHHVPERPDVTRHDPGALARTMERITQAGYPVDVRLWLPPTDETLPVAATCEHSPPGPEGTCSGDCSNTGPN